MGNREDVLAVAANRRNCRSFAQPSCEVRWVNAVRPPGDAHAVGIPVDNSLCERFGVKIPHQFFSQQSTGDAAMWIARRVLSSARAGATGCTRETKPERRAVVRRMPDVCNAPLVRLDPGRSPVPHALADGFPAWFGAFCPHI